MSYSRLLHRHLDSTANITYSFILFESTLVYQEVEPLGKVESIMMRIAMYEEEVIIFMCEFEGGW